MFYCTFQGWWHRILLLGQAIELSEETVWYCLLFPSIVKCPKLQHSQVVCNCLQVFLGCHKDHKPELESEEQRIRNRQPSFAFKALKFVFPVLEGWGEQSSLVGRQFLGSVS